MKAVILAAGLGTRLRPLTLERPKAAVPVAGRPSAAWAARSLGAAGITDVAVNLHHLAGGVEEALGDGSAHGVRIAWSDETGRILGTGGGIRLAASRLGASSLIVVNGDVICDLDLAHFLAHHERSGAAVTLALVRHPDHARYGTVVLGPDGLLASIAGHRARRPGPGPDQGLCTVFSGISVLGPQALDRLPAEGCLVRDTLFGMLDDGVDIAGLLHEGYWNDIGTPREYLGCNLDVLRGRAGRLAPDAGIGPRLVFHGASVGPGAVLEEDVILGAGARVEPGVRLERVVVWDGAHVRGSHRGAIITARHVLEVEKA